MELFKRHRGVVSIVGLLGVLLTGSAANGQLNAAFSASGNTVAFTRGFSHRRIPLPDAEIIGFQTDLYWSTAPKFKDWKKHVVNQGVKLKKGARRDVSGDFSLSPDDKWIAVAGSYQIELVEVSTGDVRPVAQGTGLGKPVWVNEKKFHYAISVFQESKVSDRDSIEFCEATLAGTNVNTRPVATASRLPYDWGLYHIWSPDGNAVILCPTAEDPWAYIDMRDGTTVNFGAGLPNFPYVSWARDGRQAICMSVTALGANEDKLEGFLFDGKTRKARNITAKHKQIKRHRLGNEKDFVSSYYELSPFWTSASGHVCFEDLCMFVDPQTWKFTDVKERVKQIKDAPKIPLYRIHQLPADGWYALWFVSEVNDQDQAYWLVNEDLTQARPFEQLSEIEYSMPPINTSHWYCISRDGKRALRAAVPGQGLVPRGNDPPLRKYPTVIALEPPLTPLPPRK